MSKRKNNNVLFKAKLAIFAGVIALSSAQSMADVLNPIIGNLLYEENFNTLDSNVWNSIDGDGCEIGLCGWGNQELEYYSPANLSIVNVPFEPATKALAIQARREVHGTHSFTSGKITSADKLQVKYGLIEFRMSSPQVGVGLWPAGWMLGTSLASWPSKGELDIMEMGHSAAGMAGAGLAGSDINAYTASNAIYYSSAACVDGNPSCAAMTAWQTKNAYVASTPLANRFVIYRMYWTDTQIRFTVIDNNVEHDMYAAPIPITADSSEFNAPFYFLFNLAVGGNFTDAATPAQVTAPLPGTLYIDYIRVYQLNGLGEVKLGSQVPKETGTYGVFTDNTPTSAKETIGTTADFWIWNTASMSPGTLPAYEGSGVLALKYTAPNQWFGGGVASRQAHDMSNFANGFLKFKVKVPANVAFKITVNDTYTNSGSVTFPANTTTYGLVRDGNWGQATIPIADIRGINALQSMSTLFSFVSVDGALPQATFDMAFDDIVWDCGGGAGCQATSSSSSVAVSSSKSSSSAPASSKASSVSSSSKSSSAPASSAPSSSKSSSVPASSVPASSKASSVASSSSAASGNGYTVLSASSIRFYVNNAPWADIHFTVNGGAQQNVRMTLSGANNTYDVTGLTSGAVVSYSFTIGVAAGGATDTSTANVTCCSGATSSAAPSSVASSSKSSSSSSKSSSSAASSAGSPVLLTVAAASASTQLQPAANAIDKNGGTRWESATAVDPSWLTLDLGSAHTLSSIAIDWEAANAANYTVQGSNDNTNWATLATVTGGAFGNRTDTLTLSGSYRYVRIYGTVRSVGNSWGYSIWEARVTGF